jgi:hypothetical protein
MTAVSCRTRGSESSAVESFGTEYRYCQTEYNVAKLQKLPTITASTSQFYLGMQ